MLPRRGPGDRAVAVTARPPGRGDGSGKGVVVEGAGADRAQLDGEVLAGGGDGRGLCPAARITGSSR